MTAITDEEYAALYARRSQLMSAIPRQPYYDEFSPSYDRQLREYHDYAPKWRAEMREIDRQIAAANAARRTTQVA